MNALLESHRVKNGRFGSSEADGFNGFFELQVNGEALRVIASDGAGWQHVSVSKALSNKVPNWEHMSRIKELFWGDDVWVVQFHPAKKDYVNNHPGCLHLWRPTLDKLPTPPPELTGWKEKTPEDVNAMSPAQRLAIYEKANARK